MNVVYVFDGTREHMAEGPEDVTMAVPYLLDGTLLMCGMPVRELDLPVLGFPAPTTRADVCAECEIHLHASR